MTTPRKKGNKWEVSYRIKGYNKTFAERYDTLEEANLRCAEIALEKKRGTLKPPDSRTPVRLITVAQFMDEYVREYGVTHWGDSYLSANRHRIEHYINPAIGSILLRDLTAKQLDSFYHSLLTTKAVVLGAAVGVGFNVAQKAWNGEKIDGEEIVETALITGADFGVKAAAAGALKVGVEKGFVQAIPKGTPAGTIANIAFVAVENIKVIGEMASGKLNAKEGLEKMERTTVSTVVGMAAAAKGATIGATVGSVLGPVGWAVGGFIGGTVGYMAGSKVGDTVVRGVQKIRHTVVETVKSGSRKVKDIVSGVKRRFLFA